MPECNLEVRVGPRNEGPRSQITNNCVVHASSTTSVSVSIVRLEIGISRHFAGHTNKANCERAYDRSCIIHSASRRRNAILCHGGNANGFRPAGRSIVEQRGPIKIRELIAADEKSRVSNAKERGRRGLVGRRSRQRRTIDREKKRQRFRESIEFIRAARTKSGPREYPRSRVSSIR